jgi:Asp-tRNA(Asn)/Glu-tRNA(Gln) amidotransferase B subunit
VSIEPHYDRVEIKNINSFSSITESIEYEYERQLKEIEKGKIKKETRAWTGTETVPMRTKEESSDYRFIPEQDLPKLIIDSDMIKTIEDIGNIDIEKMLEDLLKKGMKRRCKYNFTASCFVQTCTIHNKKKEYQQKMLDDF